MADNLMTSESMKRVGACPLCGNGNYDTFFRADGFALLRCDKCGLARTELQKELKFFGSELYQSRKEALKQFAFERGKYGRYAENVLNFLYRRNGRLLDVGCGFGWLVGAARRRGFNKPVGIDSSGVFTRLGRKKLGLDLRKTLFEKFRTSEKFDVIVLNHVLEHVREPNVFLRKAIRLLNKGGEIFVACPNIASLMYLLFKEKWYGLQPGQHYWQFSPETLAELLQNNGLRVKRLRTANMDYEPEGIKKLIFKILIAAAGLMNMGDQIYLVAEKSG